MNKIYYHLVCCIMLITTMAYANDGFILDSLDHAMKLSNMTNKPILLICGTDNCMACIELKSDISSLSIKHVDEYIICYIDLKKDIRLKRKLNISSIPDSRIIQDNKEIAHIIGYKKSAYEMWLEHAR